MMKVHFLPKMCQSNKMMRTHRWDCTKYWTSTHRRREATKKKKTRLLPWTQRGPSAHWPRLRKINSQSLSKLPATMKKPVTCSRNTTISLIERQSRKTVKNRRAKVVKRSTCWQKLRKSS